MALFWILLATLAVSAVIAVLIVRRGRSRAQARLAEVPGEVRRTTAGRPPRPPSASRARAPARPGARAPW